MFLFLFPGHEFLKSEEKKEKEANEASPQPAAMFPCFSLPVAGCVLCVCAPFTKAEGNLDTAGWKSLVAKCAIYFKLC